MSFFKRLTFVVYLLILAIDVQSSKQYVSGDCGDNVFFRYYTDTQILHIMGSGPMWDFDQDRHPFWEKWKNGIREVIVHKGVSSIGANSFAECQNLKRVCCKEGLLRIEDHAFDFCFRLSFIDIPSTLNYIGNLAFRESLLLDTIQFSGTLKQWCAINHKDSYIFTFARNVCFQGEKLTKLVIPSNVDRVNNYAFSGANFVDSIILLSTTIIEDSSFSIIHQPAQLIGCLSGVSESGQQWVLENGRLTIIKDNDIFVDPSWKKYGVFLKSLSIIGSNVSLRFIENKNSYVNLQECTLPESVKSIDPLFFSACPNLRKIVILSPTPPTVSWPEWMELPSFDLRIFVPAKGVEKYEKDVFWGKLNIFSCDSL